MVNESILEIFTMYFHEVTRPDYGMLFQFKTILVAKRLLFHAVERNFGKLGSEASTIGALRGQSRVHFLRGGRWMFTFSQPPNTPNF